MKILNAIKIEFNVQKKGFQICLVYFVENSPMLKPKLMRHGRKMIGNGLNKNIVKTTVLMAMKRGPFKALSKTP